MSLYAVKGALREVKNYTKGYSDIQAKVRSATSNDPWGPSGTVMNEIAQATHIHQDFIEIMEMIDKRLNDSGKNWRHVFKALTVLDYCIHSGSDYVIQYARDNLYIVKTLKEFQYVDEEGKDQGANVRQKANDITELLSDPALLAQKRSIRNVMHDRMTNSSNNAEFSSGRYSDDTNNYTDEDKEMQKAIEESKRTAQEHEKKMMRASEEDLRAAIQLSEKEKVANLQRQNSSDFFASDGGKAGNNTHQQDLLGVAFGGGNEFGDKRQNSFDFFASAPQPSQQQSFDPFMSLDSGKAGNRQDLFGVGGSMNNFNPYQQQQQQQQFGGNDFNKFQNIPPNTNHSTNPFGAAFGGSSVQTPPVSNNMNNFGSAFDRGKQMSAGDNRATGAQIDPFANLSSNRSGGEVSGHHLNNPFGATTGSDTFGGVMAPIGQTPPFSAPATFPSGLPTGIRPNLVNLDALSNTPPANTSSSPFASRNPFASSSGISPNLSGSGSSQKKHDWSNAGGGGGNVPKQQRTLAEMAATGGSPNMSSGPRTMAGMGASGFGAMGGAGQQQQFAQPPGSYPQGMFVGQGQGQFNPTMGNQQGGQKQRNNGNVFF